MYRATAAKDVEFMLPIALAEGWMIGRNDPALIFNADPTGFFIGEQNGVKICILSLIKYPQFVYVGIYAVDKAFRKQGYGLKMWKFAFKTVDLGAQNVGILSVMGMRQRYEQHGFRQVWISQQCVLNSSAVAEMVTPALAVSLKNTREVDFETLSDYDALVFGTARQNFLEKWILNPDAFSWSAVDENGAIVGFIVVRKTLQPENGRQVGPLFANNTSIAKLLLQKAAECMVSERVCKDEKMILLSPTGASDEVAGFADGVYREAGVGEVFEAAQMFTRGVPVCVAAGINRVFAITTSQVS